jgi:LuxR family maltose regulon positive regulatory protein
MGEHVRAGPLSARETAVVCGIADGLTNREISQDLEVSLATVKRHVTHLYGKLQVVGRPEAVERALMLGIVREESDQ